MRLLPVVIYSITGNVTSSLGSVFAPMDELKLLPQGPLGLIKGRTGGRGRKREREKRERERNNCHPV
jgi:hypothetical protein